MRAEFEWLGRAEKSTPPDGGVSSRPGHSAEENTFEARKEGGDGLIEEQTSIRVKRHKWQCRKGRARARTVAEIEMTHSRGGENKKVSEQLIGESSEADFLP